MRSIPRRQLPVIAVRAFAIPQNRDRVYDWLRGSAAGLVPLALLVGAGAGAGAVGFRYLIIFFTKLFTGRDDFSTAGHASSPHFPGLGIFFILIVPVIGGLVYGPIVDRFAKEARGHGVPEVMLAVAERGGRIPPAVAVVKSLASALCIGAGGSVGREGPIVQIGSALGSSLGQLLRMSETRLRLLVACGAAGGISATFNAPIAGVFFALELILRDFQTESFGVVVLSSVTASVIGRAAFGDYPFLQLPSFTLNSPAELLLYAGLGVIAAVVGVVFIRVLYGIEDLADRLWRWPEAWRPAVGGLLLGLLLLALPQMYGVGYPVLQNGVAGKYVAGMLILLLVGKIVATSLTIGIGGSGGVFAPSLFMGAMLGTVYGMGVHHLFPGSTAEAGAYGLVGMGAVFAGAARAPITAVLIIFELTGDYRIILPLMFAISLAAGVSNIISHDSIYTLKLRRRGINIMRGRQANLMEIITVGEAMQRLPRPLRPRASLTEIIQLMSDERLDALPVVDGAGAYRGVVDSRDVEAAVRDNTIDSTAEELARSTPTLPDETSLHAALRSLVKHERTGLPVVGRGGSELIGWLTHRDVLRAYSTRLDSSVAQLSPADSPAASETAASPGSVGRARPDYAPSIFNRLRGMRLVDLELTSGSPVGERVSSLDLPRSVVLVALRRGGKAISPDEDLVLERGDRLSLLTPAAQADTLTELIRASRDGSAPGS
jgi:chloride channel protein, CIC family